MVLVDCIKLKQAVLNLLANAVDASPVNGQVELAWREDEQWVEIDVTDQGAGIPASDVERVFSPFFSTKAQGTGLGLTFAQKIVSLHGGTITARNNPQGGATFSIALPRQPASPE
jgi:signal transduction histidine kinase